MNVTNLTITNGDDQFYPTPPSVAKKMLEDVDWRYISTVLEPSAGKGDLIKALAEEQYDRCQYQRNSIDVDAIEIDPYLREICKYNFSEQAKNQIEDRWSREYKVLDRVNLHVVHDDFMTYESFKRYDLIVMNPPFKDGHKHLLKALEMQKNGGAVICLLNAETIRNPYSFSRRHLAQKLEEYNATIEYMDDAFSTDAERRADVDVAIVKVYIPQATQESTFFERMKKAVDEKYTPDAEISALVPSGTIDQAICLYKAEVAATMAFIDEYRALTPYMYKDFDDKYKSPILKLVVDNDSTYGSFDTQKYMRMVRLKYWRALFTNEEFTGKLTSNLKEKYQKQVEKMADYEFSAFNIKQIMVEMNAEMQQGVHDTILTLFDKLTVEHTWYPECAKNRHYFNGWKTNKAHKVGKKCIIPENGIFSSYSWSKDTFDVRNAYKVISDIEKAFDYLDGGRFEGSRYNLESFLRYANENHQTRNIDFTYFKVDLYKKGTVHIKFRPEAMPLVERLNIFAAQNRGWLPPNYGQERYNTMDADEKAVVDSFNGDGTEGSGEKAYAEIMRESDYYLAAPTNTMLALGSAE